MWYEQAGVLERLDLHFTPHLSRRESIKDYKGICEVGLESPLSR